MMKANMKKILIVAILAALAAVPISARAEGNYALLVQSSPPDAGVVTPGLGVHEIEIGQTVALAATPKSGYRFAYWLGDVSSAGASETTILADSPKLVVAVFVREDFEEELPGIRVIKGQYGGSGQRGVPSPISSPGSVSPGYDDNPPGFKFPDGTGDDEIPVPGDDEIPVPGDGEVPEPATIALLALGGIFLRKRK